MTLQFKPAAYKVKNVQVERDLMRACRRLSCRVLKFLDRDRKRGFVKCAPALAATIVIVVSLTTSAIAQERQRAYGEYTYWFGGAFENGHAFSSTVGARNYQLESRYERLIYSRKPFAVRWVFDAVPIALVGDRYTRSGRRAYSYGVGGSPIGAQINFVHFEPESIDPIHCGLRAPEYCVDGAVRLGDRGRTPRRINSLIFLRARAD
jgi:hypothetical protein